MNFNSSYKEDHIPSNKQELATTVNGLVTSDTARVKCDSTTVQFMKEIGT